MSHAGNGQPESFRVLVAEKHRIFLQELFSQKIQQGTGEELLVQLRQLYHRLRHDPLEFGEPLYHLPTLDLEIRQAVIAPLAVTYGVNVKQALVYVREIRTLSE